MTILLTSACDSGTTPTAEPVTHAAAQQGVPGTRPANDSTPLAGRGARGASSSLQVMASFVGKFSLSIDGVGISSSTGVIEVEKPAGATVRAAYLMAASQGFTSYPIVDGEVLLDGLVVPWTTIIPSAINSHNAWADVTALVQAKLDAAPAGRVSFTIDEAQSFLMDGEVMVVVFDDPGQAQDNTIALLFGAQDVLGDDFLLTLDQPYDPTVTSQRFEMSLGISYSYQQSDDQTSETDVNGIRLTSSAGGEDDGASLNGALLTVGGLDDSALNPPPASLPGGNPRLDDELYDLQPFLSAGDSQIVVHTLNPSLDDNIFFAAFFLTAPTKIIVGDAPTTTTLSSMPNPSTFGAVVDLTATIRRTSDATPASGGTVTFIDGGTCAAPLLVLGVGPALDAAGQSALATAVLSGGIHSVAACYSGATGYLPSEGSATHTVTPVATTTTASVSQASRQWSDWATLTAIVDPQSVNGHPVTGTVQFLVDGVPFGAAVTVNTTTGVAVLTGEAITQKAGAHGITAQFTSSDPGFASSTSAPVNLNVLREDATVTPGAANPAIAPLLLPGTVTGTVSFSFVVAEGLPDLPAGSGAAGDLLRADLNVRLMPIGSGRPVALGCTGGPVVGTGYGATRAYTCSADGIPAGTYEVVAATAGDYWVGGTSDVFTAGSLRAGVATGGGRFSWPTSGLSTSIGFTLNYSPTGKLTGGQLLVIQRTASGTFGRLKSTSMATLALGKDGSIPMGYLTAVGKGTYTAPGSSQGTPNRPFILYAEDRNNPGSGIDRIWLGGVPPLLMPGLPPSAAIPLLTGDFGIAH